MPRRPLRKLLPTVALALLLALSSAPSPANAQLQQPSQGYDAASAVLHGHAGFEKSYNANEKQTGNPVARLKGGKLKESQTEDVRAIATTYAPAGWRFDDPGRAVRAPPAYSAADSSLRHRTRSLQDWEVEDIVLLATVDGSLHARNRNTGTPLWELHVDHPMVTTKYHRSNTSSDERFGQTDPSKNYIWIVEPTQDGDIYTYTAGASYGMQYLGITVKAMENLGPWHADDPAVVFTGTKQSQLFDVDVKTGRLLTRYHSEGSTIYSQGKCRQDGELSSLDDEECGSMGTLTLGRTEYRVGIQSRSGEPLCTIYYNEWVPNNYDRDLTKQYTQTKDGKYIYTSFDGSVYGLDLSVQNEIEESKPSYRQNLESPVARVFDVVRPANPTTRDVPLIILPQPTAPLVGLSPLIDTDTRVFVNCTKEGSWFALSERSYPMVTDGAPKAFYAQSDLPFSLSTLEISQDKNLRKGLVGVHDLAYHGSVYKDVPLLPGPETSDQALETVKYKHVPVDPAEKSRIASTTYSGIGVLSTLLLIVLTSFLALYSRSPQLLRASRLPFLSKPDAVAEVVFSEPGVETLAQPSEHVKPKDIPEAEVTKDLGAVTGLPQEAMPQEAIDEAKEIVNSEDASVAAEDEKPNKKKAHRGKRGGRKLAEKRNQKSQDENEVLTSILEGAKQQLDHQVSVPPTSNGTPSAPSLQNLEINTDVVLGTGSGGTFVFEGTFEGKKVAVKRMLPQFYELASQEVSLLEDNETHPNVIRYFCRREDQNFLYIALELCQASLWDLFHDGRNDDMADPRFIAIVQDVMREPVKVLEQLAEGVKYLHSFRIVHRDIKPQNMLIAYPKKNTVGSFPRFVISDFGLCKTLPDNASTLIGATGNAGTAGWKAPELILVPRESVSGSQASTGKDSLAPGENREPQPGAPGVKRAIDIFSLGCVFFYVLTGGHHPFDDEEGWMALRERNIKANRLNLAAIQLLGPETVDLIEWMLAPKPEERPNAGEVLAHPFFWNAEERLEFLSLASDRFDTEPRDGTSEALAELESNAESIIKPPAAPAVMTNAAGSALYSRAHQRSSLIADGAPATPVPVPPAREPDFLSMLDKKFVDTLGKQRKYSGNKLVDLLRALRNKHHHWDDMPDDVKAKVGSVPDGYLQYWESKFPSLVVRVWRVVRKLEMGNERRFYKWFEGKGG